MWLTGAELTSLPSNLQSEAALKRIQAASNVYDLFLCLHFNVRRRSYHHLQAVMALQLTLVVARHYCQKCSPTAGRILL